MINLIKKKPSWVTVHNQYITLTILKANGPNTVKPLCYLQQQGSPSKYCRPGGKILSWRTLISSRDSIPYTLLSLLLSDAQSNISHWISSPRSDRHPRTAAFALRAFPRNLLGHRGWEWSHPDGCHLWAKTPFSYVFLPGKPVLSRYLLLHSDAAKDAGELPLLTQSNFFLGMHKPASLLPLPRQHRGPVVGRDGFWPLRGYLQTTSLHSYHESLGLYSNGCHCLDHWFFPCPDALHNDLSLTLLWFQPYPSLLLWY